MFGSYSHSKAWPGAASRVPSSRGSRGAVNHHVAPFLQVPAHEAQHGSQHPGNTSGTTCNIRFGNANGPQLPTCPCAIPCAALGHGKWAARVTVASRSLKPYFLPSLSAASFQVQPPASSRWESTGRTHGDPQGPGRTVLLDSLRLPVKYDGIATQEGNSPSISPKVMFNDSTIQAEAGGKYDGEPPCLGMDLADHVPTATRTAFPSSLLVVNPCITGEKTG